MSILSYSFMEVPVIMVAIIILCLVYDAIVRNVYSLVAIKWLVYWNRFCIPKATDYTCPFIVLLLPALREQSIVEKTLKHFQTIYYPPGKLKIIIVTTEKENYAKKRKENQLTQLFNHYDKDPSLKTLIKYNNNLFHSDDLFFINAHLRTLNRRDLKINFLKEFYNKLPTTSDLTELEVQKMNKEKGEQVFYHIHFPYTKGTKSSQLNYAINMLPEICGNFIQEGNLVYIGVYDFDSLPDRRTLDYIAWHIGSNKSDISRTPVAFQQAALSLKNYFTLNNKLECLLLNCHALMHSRRVLGIELYRLLRESKKKYLLKKFRRSCIYGIGAGIFIRLDYLKKIGLFPEPVDDIPLGYKITFFGENIVPIPFLNLMDVPDKLNKLPNQLANIFSGVLRVNIERDYIARNFNIEKHLCNNFLTVKESISNLCWLVGPIALIAGFIYVLTDAKFILLYLLILAMFANSSLTIFLGLKRLSIIFSIHDSAPIKKDIPTFKRIILCLISPIEFFWRSSGPHYYIFKLLKSRLLGIGIEFNKTER